MRTIFSKEQIAGLRKHPCIFGISEKLVSYTYEFKRRALELHAEGISPNEIWKRAGFDVAIWKKGYCGWTIKDWKRLVRRGGLQRLVNLGGIQSDRGSKDEKEKMKRLTLQVKYLEAENDFLAKLRAKKTE
jgi:hypothetical protein